MLINKNREDNIPVQIITFVTNINVNKIWYIYIHYIFISDENGINLIFISVLLNRNIATIYKYEAK